MSRIGIKPIALPAGVEVSVGEKNLVTVKGPKGELQEQISPLLNIEINEGVVTVSRDSDALQRMGNHLEGMEGLFFQDYRRIGDWSGGTDCIFFPSSVIEINF